MHTENEIVIHGPMDRVFDLAADVLRWPERLPHYRWVRLVESDGRRRVVEMAARRGRIPVRWRSIQEVFPGERRITYQHIGGLTRGMEVEWTLTPRADGVHVRIRHDFQPSWPLIGHYAGRYIVGEFFVKNIAGKTLRRIRDLVEAETKLGREGAP